MYVEKIPNRGSRPAYLLRQGWREQGGVRKRTLANLSHWPLEQIEALRAVLRGEPMVPARQHFHVERSLPHGHVEAVLGFMSKLGVDQLLSSRRCRQRDLVMAMIAQHLLAPCSKLAATRSWGATTLAQELEVAGADENELYEALDWLLSRKNRIEGKLAKRHLGQGTRALYDVTSSTYYGQRCPLAERGYNREHKGRNCITWGLLADAEGRPVALETYKGATGDPATLQDQVNKLRKRFGLSRVVLVGDRGMLTQARIDALKQHPELGWISALPSQAIRALAEQGELQLSLFDKQNLAEITCEAYPGERLMVCYNPVLAQDRKRTRNQLLEHTEKELARIQAEVNRRTRTPLTAGEIGQKAGRAVHRFKMAKHFQLDIQDGHFAYQRNAGSIEAEARLDGIYIVRTSEPAQQLSAEDAVRAYKSLEQVEQAFRCMKTLDLRVRPIRHRTEAHVKAHMFLCMLAYYVEWHMRQALAPILFQDEELAQTRWTRDPVAPAETSAKAKQKNNARHTQDGWPVHSLQTLLQELATRTKNTCRVNAQEDEGAFPFHFEEITEPTPFQKHVFDLLGLNCA